MADQVAMDATPADADVHLREIITSLYFLLTQTHSYIPSNTPQAMTAELRTLLQALVSLSQTSRRLPTKIPLDLVEYVEKKRNPDVYKRELVEAVMKGNQMQKGRAKAFGDLRDVLGREMIGGIPEIREEVGSVLEACGGRVEG
ncbi:RNA polymerase II mediator complex subunit [Oleoguttula sp. CCFEE 5521]